MTDAKTFSTDIQAYRIAYLAQRWGVTPEVAAMLAALAFGGGER